MSKNTEENGNSTNTDGLTTTQYARIINQGTGYEPSKPVKRTYLPLRKNERLWGGVKYPGLFDYDPANDAGWFWFTIILEFISLGTTYFLLQERITNTVLAISAICIFFLDFTFAYFHHKYKTAECLIENKKRLFIQAMRPGNFAGEFARYAAHLDITLDDDKNRKYGRVISAILIWFLCLTKGVVFFIAVVSSYWFQMAVSDSKTPYLLIIFVIASYLWIAYNHLKFTGYFIAALYHKWKYNTEHNEYKRQVGKQNINERDEKHESFNFEDFSKLITADKTNPFLMHFIAKSQEALQDELANGIKICKVQSHGIIKKNSGEYDYTIYRYGLLTDDQLQIMVNQQESQLAQITVAIFGHTLQMQSGNF